MLYLLAVCSDERDKDTVLAEGDAKGCSAVHWAAYNGDVEGLKLLNRFRGNFQQVDNLQNTPLHLAVQAERKAVGTGEIESTIALLIKHGVDPGQENARGQTCMDIAKERDSDNEGVLASLEHALARFSKLSKQTKKTDVDVLDLEAGLLEEVVDPMSFKEKIGPFFPGVVWIICVSLTVLEYIMHIRKMAWGSWWLWVPAFMFECGVPVSLGLFFYVARGDPGIVPFQNGPEFLLRSLKSGQEIPAKRLCTTSWVLKDLRTKYCKQTGACVQEFDHFCDFTNCAIGKKNHRIFLVLLMIEPATQLLYLFLCAWIVYWTQGVPSSAYDPASSWMDAGTTVITSWATWALESGWRYPLMTMNTGIHCASISFLLYLLASQFYIIANNVTQNDLHNWDRYDHLWQNDSKDPAHKNCFNKGDAIINTLDFWWFRQRREVGPHARPRVRDLVAALHDAGAK
jgi:hypothetical protein